MAMSLIMSLDITSEILMHMGEGGEEGGGEDQNEVEDDIVDVKDDDDGDYDDDIQNDKDDDITMPNGGSTQVASEMVPGLNCP